MQSNKTARYWIGTAPSEKMGFSPWWPLPEFIKYAVGQQERGAGGLVHWQFVFILSNAQRRTFLSTRYPNVHFEATRSEAALSYCTKEETRIAGTEFELGRKPLKRSSKTDWEDIREKAKRGALSEIPGDVYIRYYGNLRRICADNAVPVAMERTVTVYWGTTGVGKSRRAWEEAGSEAYCKDPLTKWWCGYRGEKNVIIDEFRGTVSIQHILRWFDRYPVLVETKGSSQPLLASNIWITSNLHPRDWYKDLDSTTYEALERRLKIVEIVKVGSGF